MKYGHRQVPVRVSIQGGNMARITAEDCLRHIQSPFSLVHAAVRRARQLQLGSKPLIMKKYDKMPVIALREIAAGVVEQVDVADNENELQKFLIHSTPPQKISHNNSFF